MSTLIIATVVNKNACVAKTAKAVLIVVLAPLGVMIDASSHLYEGRCFLRAFERARELFLPQVVLRLNEVVGIAVLPSVDFRIQLAFADGLRNGLVLFRVVQSIFLLFISQEYLGLLLVYLLQFLCFRRTLIIIG